MQLLCCCSHIMHESNYNLQILSRYLLVHESGLSVYVSLHHSLPQSNHSALKVIIIIGIGETNSFENNLYQLSNNSVACTFVHC